MDSAEALVKLTSKPTGHLATVDRNGLPHVVVVTYAVVGGNVVTAVDQKPKSTRTLKRLRNVEATRKASFLVDHYEEDWSQLWWVRVDGPASIIRDGATFEDALDALVEKYPQYRQNRPQGPVIYLSQSKVTGWSAAG